MVNQYQQDMIPGMESFADPLYFQQFMQQLKGMKGKGAEALLKTFPKTGAKIGAGGLVKMGSRRFPLIAGGLQTIGGDPIGGAGTAAGGTLGAVLGGMTPLGPVGSVLGAYLGGKIGESTTRGLAGIDVNNPLTGPDLTFMGIPLSQYAKTKKAYQRGTELAMERYNQLQPLMEEAKNREFSRQLTQQQVQTAGNLLNTIYGRI